MSRTFMDERYQENKIKVHMTANKISLTIIFLAAIVMGQGMEYCYRNCLSSQTI
jgi:hypothetical protein